VTYERFVSLMPCALGPLSAYLKVCTDNTAAFYSLIQPRWWCVIPIGSTTTRRSKGSMGWFYGLKLHLIVNDRGEILACQLTPGKTDDRKPVPALCKSLFGKLIADRGYISQPLFEQLLV